MFVYTLNAWLLAQLLHPCVFIGYFFLRNPDEINPGDAIYFFMFLPVVFFISIPSLLIARLFLSLVSNSMFSLNEKMILWIISAGIAIILNFTGLLLLIDGKLIIEDFEYMIPSIIAAFLSILLRNKAFFDLQLNYKSYIQ